MIYQMPEGDWAFAAVGIISDGYPTEEAAWQAEQLAIEDVIAKAHAEGLI